MINKILLVDDEPNILEGYKRQLRRQFSINTAVGAEEGLAFLASHGPYAVVVSDLRMPSMDGIQFLGIVRKKFPDIVRVMLTGAADMEDAISAVNEGNIFRFLNKPCPAPKLTKVLSDSLEQYRLLTAERELLGKTVRGCIKVLTEILSLINPVAFSQSSRIKRNVIRIAKQLNFPDKWKFELAAMLSQIGCITLPTQTLKKAFANELLSGAGKQIFESHPSVARSLLDKIPRLEEIGRMIEGQFRPFSDYPPAEQQNKEAISLGGQILKAALDFDLLVTNGSTPSEAITRMEKATGQYNPTIVRLLSGYEQIEEKMETQLVEINELVEGMILDQEVLAKNGLLLVSKGHEVTYLVIERFNRLDRIIGVLSPIKVIIPKGVKQRGRKEINQT